MPLALSHAEKRHLLEHGFVRIPGVVAPLLVRHALRAINHSLGEGADPAKVTTFRAQSWCPELVDQPAIMDLFHASPVQQLCASLFGAGRLKPPGRGQVALRFPSLLDPPKRHGAHIDGMYTPTNGMTPGQVWNFGGLACVYLNDLPGPDRGNFTVWPGSHRRHERYFREHGAAALVQGMPPIDLGEPLMLTGNAGDLIIAHYLLGHTAGPNTGPDIRYACFFRLETHQQKELGTRTMTDAWLDWPGMQEVVQAPGSPVAAGAAN